MLTKPAIGGQWEAGIEHMYRRGALWIGRECSTYLSQKLESLEVVRLIRIGIGWHAADNGFYGKLGYSVATDGVAKEATAR